MAEEIREVLNLLNEKLAGVFPYRLELAAPGELRLLEKNARYMKAEQFQNLVENVKKDGNLSSLPLCYREKDGKLRALSGNHRVMAARKAEVESVLVMVLGDEKDADEQLAIQLSHNAIAGQDETCHPEGAVGEHQGRAGQGVCRSGLRHPQGPPGHPVCGHIRAALAVQADQFSVSAGRTGGPGPLLKETAVAFAGDAVYLAHLSTFDTFFELVTRIKKRCQIKNSAAAFLKLMELARYGLEQYEEALAAQEATEEANHGMV